jgi:hypothetical protein
MTNLPWGDLKVAFPCGPNADRLWRAHEAGKVAYPTGWELCETDASGARLVAVFRVSGAVPTVEDGIRVRAELRRWSK